MFGRGLRTSALGLYEIMQLENKCPAPTTASILYFNSDGQVARGPTASLASTSAVREPTGLVTRQMLLAQISSCGREGIA